MSDTRDPKTIAFFAFFAISTCSTSEICAFVRFAIFQFPITRKIVSGNPIDKDSRDLINAFRLILDSMKSDEGPLGISEMSQQIRNNL